MKTAVFTGVCTALITPFCNGKVDYDMLKRLLDRQMSAGIQSIVLCGTTGEAPTLSSAEKIKIVQSAKLHTGNDCTIIAGTGCNDTQTSIVSSIAAEEAAADALLVVSPYYNKSTPEGLYAHYSAIAAAVHIPVIIYNVPSRTGQDIPVSVYKKLSAISNISGVKEASTDIKKCLEIKSSCPSEFYIWSGNDDMIVPVMALGGTGVISVLSNLYPEETNIIAQAALAGDFDTASAMQIQMHPIIRLLFSEVNPIPVKQAMKILGYDCGDCRMPLIPASEALKMKLTDMLLNR